MSACDVDRAHRLLRRAAPLAPSFADAACRRLPGGDDSSATTGLAELLAEMLEKAADVGALAALAEQALDQQTDIEEAERESLAVRIVDAARKTGWAWARIAQSGDILAPIDREVSQ